MNWRNDISALRQSVAEVRQQVQQVSDAIPHIVEKLSSGFAELRDQNREIRQALTQVQGLLVETRREAEQAAATAAAVARELEESRRAQAAAAPVSGGEQDADGHERLLALAAGVSSAELVCHRDTWAFVVEQASRGEHFRLPAELSEEPDGAVEVDLSGRTLIAALDALWTVQSDPATSAGSRHLAALVYERVGDALGRVRPVSVEAPTDDGAGREVGRTRIVIDDRPTLEVEGGSTT